jgi:RNA polymerase sigma factor (TIGR02999 family)
MRILSLNQLWVTYVTGPMGDVTLILQRISSGDANARQELMPLVYRELRRLATSKMAQHFSGHTLQPTALVHEAWLRLGGNEQPNWDNRRHFYGAAACAMRQILIELARKRSTPRHGGEHVRVDAAVLEAQAADQRSEEVLAVHEALERRAQFDPANAVVV